LDPVNRSSGGQSPTLGALEMDSRHRVDVGLSALASPNGKPDVPGRWAGRAASGWSAYGPPDWNEEEVGTGRLAVRISIASAQCVMTTLPKTSRPESRAT